jgi:nitrate/nitrite-specific signal transduction histidine kinase
MGLKSMQARARALRGQFSLHNRRSGGCEVLLRWSEPVARD